MLVTEDALKNSLTEMYTYYFKLSRDFYNKRPEGEPLTALEPSNAYEIGKYNGAIDVLGAVLVMVCGGKEYLEIWQATLKWCDSNESEG